MLFKFPMNENHPVVVESNCKSFSSVF